MQQLDRYLLTVLLSVPEASLGVKVLDFEEQDTSVSILWPKNGSGE